MPLQRRLPKRGFTNIFKKVYALVNVKDLDRFEKGTVVNSEALEKMGIIKNTKLPVKLLGTGDVKKNLLVKVQAASKTAVEKVAASGGQVEILTL
jgi:large subunit ribosomal protein L15